MHDDSLALADRLRKAFKLGLPIRMGATDGKTFKALMRCLSQEMNGYSSHHAAIPTGGAFQSKKALRMLTLEIKD